jgi:hypothetical protein
LEERRLWWRVGSAEKVENQGTRGVEWRIRKQYGRPPRDSPDQPDHAAFRAVTTAK